jgi:glycine/serine hydroxymethyltransferase
MGLAEMDLIAHYITRVLEAPDNQAVADGVRIDVEALCRKFPLYPTLGR